jgi:adenine-specific DNA-methyltransferase
MTTPYLYILYLTDEIVAPSLELVRRICEPNARSKPHVTMGGPLRRRTDSSATWENTQIKRITLVEAGRFLSHADMSPTQNTVYMRCDLHEQAWVHYTPDYPQSVPHVTLYNGKSRDFADRLWDLLRKYSWHLYFEPAVSTTLRKVILGGRKKKRASEIEYSPEASALFRELVGKEIGYEYVASMSDKERLRITDLLCQNLHKTLHRTEPDTYSNEDNLLTHQARTLHLRKHKEIQLLLDLHDNTLAENRRVDRHQTGQFLTPPELAMEVAECAITFLPQDSVDIHFGDPAIGTGTFFSALRRVLPPSIRMATSMGVEINEALAEKTRRLWGKHGLEVIEDDFLSLDLPADRNLIISNPPYVRHQFMSNKRKNELRDATRDALSINVGARSDLLVYFVLLCHSWMQEGAVAAWLISAEFMVTDYGRVLREYLTNQVTLQVIHLFDPNEVQFDGVLATSCVVIYRKTLPVKDQLCRISFGGGVLHPKESAQIPIKKLRNLDRWPTSIRGLLKKKKNSIVLGDIFQIQRGIATGANSFFILPREEAKAKGLPDQFLRPILPSPKHLHQQIVEDDGNGYPVFEPQLVLLDCPLPEPLIEESFPALYEFLQGAKSLGILDRYLVRKRRPWYKQEHRNPPPFLCTYMGRATSKRKKPFRFILNRSSAIATNLYLLLYPKEPLQDLLNRDPELQKEVHNILNRIKPRDLCDGGRVYGGGLYKLEPRELAEIDGSSFKKILQKYRGA